MNTLPYKDQAGRYIFFKIENRSFVLSIPVHTKLSLTFKPGMCTATVLWSVNAEFTVWLFIEEDSKSYRPTIQCNGALLFVKWNSSV